MGHWLEDLRRAFESARGEPCHGGCEDRAEKLVTRGRHIGAWCWECWGEIAHGRIPGPVRRRGRR